MRHLLAALLITSLGDGEPIDLGAPSPPRPTRPRPEPTKLSPEAAAKVAKAEAKRARRRARNMETT